jgi:hypothetical protein
MATRKPIKARSRQNQTAEPEGAVASVSPNGVPITGTSAAKNGASPSFDQIQRRAYELFMARGGTHGCDWADWFTAERELTGTSAAAY